MRVLIVDDDPHSALACQRLVADAGHRPYVVKKGDAARAALRDKYYHVVITESQLADGDSTELIRHIRATIFPAPVIVLLARIDSPESRQLAMGALADHFLVKPLTKLPTRRLLDDISNQLLEPIARTPATLNLSTRPSLAGGTFRAIGVASSTGGPEALEQFLSHLPHPCPAAVVIVQHGPAWMMKTLCSRLSRHTPHRVLLAEAQRQVAPGAVYLAAGERHLVLGSGGRLQFKDGPPINGVKPSADPLFESLAKHFGCRAVAVVLTGLGRDGAHGAKQIKRAGGHVLAQAPHTAVAPFMPEAAIELGIVEQPLPIVELPAALQRLCSWPDTGGPALVTVPAAPPQSGEIYRLRKTGKAR